MAETAAQANGATRLSHAVGPSEPPIRDLTLGELLAWAAETAPRGDSVAYVFASVRNAAIDQSRRRRPASGVEQPEAASIYDGQEADPATAAMNGELVRRVARAVDSLPDDQRDVVVMRIYGGLTYAQIAEALGRPLPTVAGRYRLALERLRSQMGGGDER